MSRVDIAITNIQASVELYANQDTFKKKWTTCNHQLEDDKGSVTVTTTANDSMRIP